MGRNDNVNLVVPDDLVEDIVMIGRVERIVEEGVFTGNALPLPQ